MSTTVRIGLLGGTFDPIHLGHLDVANAARAALGLAEVIFVPSCVPPHRPHAPAASGYHRFAMVALTLTAEDVYRASDMELNAERPSYTSRTLATLGQGGVDPSQLFFITGADAFADISTWHEYPGVLDRSHFIVVSRPGHRASDLARQLPDIASRMEDSGHLDRVHQEAGKTSIWLVESKTRDISSSDIRVRVASGQPVRGLVAPSVGTYIERHRLYAFDRGVDRNLHG